MRQEATRSVPIATSQESQLLTRILDLGKERFETSDIVDAELLSEREAKYGLDALVDRGYLQKTGKYYSSYLPKSVATDNISIGRVRQTDRIANLSATSISSAALVAAGMTGSGKTSFVVNLLQNLIQKGFSAVIIDVNNEYHELLSTTLPDSVETIVYGRRHNLTSQLILETLSRRLSPDQQACLREALDKLGESPSIGRISEVVMQNTNYLESTRKVVSATIHQLSELTNEIAPRISLKPGRIIIARAEGLATEDLGENVVRALVHIDRPQRTKTVVVIESNAFALNPEKGSNFDQLLGFLRVSRKLGLMPIMVAQSISEVDKSILVLCGTWALFRTVSPTDLAILRELGFQGYLGTIQTLRAEECILYGVGTMIPVPLVVELNVS